MTADPLGPLDPDFAAGFRRDDRRPPCQLYLVSPLDVAGGFPDRLARALDAGPVAAFALIAGPLAGAPLGGIIDASRKTRELIYARRNLTGNRISASFQVGARNVGIVVRAPF